MALPSVRGYRMLKQAAFPTDTALSLLCMGVFYLRHAALALILASVNVDKL